MATTKTKEHTEGNVLGTIFVLTRHPMPLGPAVVPPDVDCGSGRASHSKHKKMLPQKAKCMNAPGETASMNAHEGENSPLFPTFVFFGF